MEVLMKLKFFIVYFVLLMCARSFPQTASKEKSKIVSKRQISRFFIDEANTVVTLRLSHNLIGRFDTPGKSGLSGFIDLVDGKKLFTTKLEFRPETFDSLIGLRDDHIKNEYLEIAKFPIVSLEKALTTLQKFSKEMPQESLLASLVVKNHSEKVEGTSQIYLENEVLRGRAEISSKISLFPIKKPNYKGVGVRDEFSVVVDLVAKPDLGENDLIVPDID